MFTKSQYLEILEWIYRQVVQNPKYFLLQDVPCGGVIDYSVGDLTRTMKKFRGEPDVVRAYEKVRELLVSRVIQLMNADILSPSVGNKLIEDTFVDLKVTGLGEIAPQAKLSDKELEKRMRELGWKRL